MDDLGTNYEDRGPDHLLEPDTVTPDQFFGLLRRRSWHDGERRLMAAVLVDGVETFQKHAFAHSPAGRELFEEVHAWVTAKDSHDLFAFDTVCEVLEIDPNYLRGGLLAWVDENRQHGVQVGARQLEDPRRRVTRRAG